MCSGAGLCLFMVRYGVNDEGEDEVIASRADLLLLSLFYAVVDTVIGMVRLTVSVLVMLTIVIVVVLQLLRMVSDC